MSRGANLLENVANFGLNLGADYLRARVQQSVYQRGYPGPGTVMGQYSPVSFNSANMGTLPGIRNVAFNQNGNTPQVAGYNFDGFLSDVLQATEQKGQEGETITGIRIPKSLRAAINRYLENPENSRAQAGLAFALSEHGDSLLKALYDKRPELYKEAITWGIRPKNGFELGGASMGNAGMGNVGFMNVGFGGGMTDFFAKNRPQSPGEGRATPNRTNTPHPTEDENPVRA